MQYGKGPTDGGDGDGDGVGGGGGGDSGGHSGQVESWEDLLDDTCEAVTALALPATAAAPPQRVSQHAAPDDALFIAGQRRARPPSIFVVTRGRPGDGGWRA